MRFGDAKQGGYLVLEEDKKRIRWAPMKESAWVPLDPIAGDEVVDVDAGEILADAVVSPHVLSSSRSTRGAVVAQPLPISSVPPATQRCSSRKRRAPVAADKAPSQKRARIEPKSRKTSKVSITP